MALRIFSAPGFAVAAAAFSPGSSVCWAYRRNRTVDAGVEIAGVTSEPDHAWMSPVSRNVTDATDGFLTAKASGASCPNQRRIRFLVWPEFAGPCAKHSHARHQEQSENGEQGGDWECDH